MNIMTPTTHPGETVTAQSIYQKALEFHQAFDTLTGDAARLLALQAIEGYLIAYVRYHGMKNDDVRWFEPRSCAACRQGRVVWPDSAQPDPRASEQNQSYARVSFCALRNFAARRHKPADGPAIDPQ